MGEGRACPELVSGGEGEIESKIPRPLGRGGSFVDVIGVVLAIYFKKGDIWLIEK